MEVFIYLVNVPSITETTYSSFLTYNHTMFSRTSFDHPYYYFESIEITAYTNDFYVITANSSIDLYGFVYKDHFDRFNPTANRLAWYGKCCNKDQFKFTLELQSSLKYVLVVTTYEQNVIGPFSIIIFGSNRVRLRRMGK